MHIEYRDGKFSGYTETGDERVEKQKELKARIAKIEEACDVEPIEFPDHFSELGELLVGLPPRDAFAPAVMAGKKRLLLCEDLMMRLRASEAFGTKGVWLQAVLISAEQAGEVSQNEHSDAVVYLAAHRHGPVSLNRQICLLPSKETRLPTYPIYRLYVLTSVILVRIIIHMPPSGPVSLIPFGRPPDLLSYQMFPLIQRL